MNLDEGSLTPGAMVGPVRACGFRTAVGVALGLSACGTSDPPAALPVAPAPVPPLPPAPAPAAPPAPVGPGSAAPVADVPAPPPDNDFEDERDYGLLDAGAGDPSNLRTRPGYASYRNGRFGFVLDVPRALDAMEPPINGDGQRWRLGGLVIVTASGILWPEPAPNCPSSANVVAHRETATTCWATGTRDGYIFWYKAVVAHGVQYSLRFQYKQELKAAMDPIVTHVNASWRF
jgi:hypothetical protein